MKNNSVTLHRIIAAPPEKVYRAFTDAAFYARWIAPNGFACIVHTMEAKVGGKIRTSYKNFTTQKEHFFGGEFKELIPNNKVVIEEFFDDPNLPPDKVTTTTLLKEVSCGTELSIVQENLPEVVPVYECYLGWQESLLYLAKLVEPDIPDM